MPRVVLGLHHLAGRKTSFDLCLLCSNFFKQSFFFSLYFSQCPVCMYFRFSEFYFFDVKTDNESFLALVFQVR